MCPLKKAAVILPYQGKRVLLQLRDEKAGIAYPSKWGFFSGTIENNEEPIQGARRELYEEIVYDAEEMFTLSVDRVYTTDELMLYAFYCPLKIPIEGIQLQEGFDCGLFTLDEICSKHLFSGKARKSYPVIDHPYMEYLVCKLMQEIDRRCLLNKSG